MKCRNNHIKELLPVYAGRELEPADAKVVEAHLALCEDCRSELTLLKLMTVDDVPDPGPAFWAEMPGRIERGVRQQQKRKGFSIRDLSAGSLVPRRYWAPAATAMAVVVVWLVLLSLPPDNPEFSNHELEYAEPGEAMTVAELTPAQLAAASQWVQNQWAPISRAINEDPPESIERDASEDLSDLSSEELDRLDKLLREQEQQVKKRIQKQKNNKNIG